MNESYTTSARGAQKRIRTPHPHDVLSGRGGGINSHAGNKVFREWVRVRKEDYNLAGSKAEKAKVANEVIDLVRGQNPPGRFLQRENNSVAGPSWWIEVDEVRALAKTSQALREGAPQIRAAHKDELDDKAKGRAKRTKRRKSDTSSTSKAGASHKRPRLSHGKASVATPAGTTKPPTDARGPAPLNSPQTRAPAPASRSVSTERAIETLHRNVEEAKLQADRQTYPTTTATMQPGTVPPLMSNKAFHDRYQNQPRVDGFAETPPLAPVPSRALPSLPPLTPFGRSKSTAAAATMENGLPRMHSLALSDVSTGEDFGMGEEDFVNPFADESDISDIYSKIDFTSPSSPSSRTSRFLRNISSDEVQQQQQQQQTAPPVANNNNNNTNNISTFLGGRQRNGNGTLGSSTMSSSSRSLAELSDILDATTTYQIDDTDFGEGMKSILDAVHPDLASPEKDDDYDDIPTLLMPWRGGGLLRGQSSLSSRSIAKRELSGRQ